MNQVLLRQLLPSINPLFMIAPVSAIAACVFFSFLSPGFASTDNYSNLLGQFCVLALLTAGQVVVMVVRGFDISVGAVVATSSALAALGFQAFGPAGLLVGPLFGIAIGAVNGWLTAYLDVQPIVSTLSTLLAARAVGRLLTDDGQPVVLQNAEWLTALAYTGFGAVPFIAWLTLLAIAALALALQRTAPGRRLYMTGSNEQAASLVGVDVKASILGAYATCGALAGLAGVVLIARTGAGLPAEGMGLELQAIAAAIIGGTALAGGVGSVSASICGAFFIQAVLTGLNLSGISPFIAQALLGILIVSSGYLESVVRSLSAHRSSP